MTPDVKKQVFAGPVDTPAAGEPAHDSHRVPGDFCKDCPSYARCEMRGACLGKFAGLEPIRKAAEPGAVGAEAIAPDKLSRGIDIQSSAAPVGWFSVEERLPEDGEDVLAIVWWVNADNPSYSRYGVHDCNYYEGGPLPDGSRQKIFADCEGDEFEHTDVSFWISKKDLAAQFPRIELQSSAAQEGQ